MSRTSKFLVGRRRKDGRKSKVSGRKGTNKEYEIKKIAGKRGDPHGTWLSNLTVCPDTSGVQILPPFCYETNSSPPPHSFDAQRSY